MGNRAIVKPINENIGVYLHWNGGVDSVTAFLEYCKLKGYRDFGGERVDGYGIARFVQVVSNFFGGTTSIGIEMNVDETEECANGLDNGIYVIDGWDIKKRIGTITDSEGYNLQEMLIDIDKAQPLEEQLGEEFFKSEIVDISEINIGDKVYLYDNIYGKYEQRTVIGIGYENYIVNGRCVKNIPFVDKYGKDNNVESYRDNPNNYLREDKVRRYSKAKEITPKF